MSEGLFAPPPSDLLHQPSPPSPLPSITMEIPPWFSPETGIYSSKHPAIPLPSAPFLDVATHVLSYHHGGTTALVDASDGSTLLYTELRSRVQSFASGLRLRAGVRPRDVVLILSPNTLLFPVIFLGAAAAGAVACPINPLSSAQEVLVHARATRATLAFASPGNAHKLLGDAPALRVVDIPECLHFDPAAFSDFHAILFHDPCDSPQAPPVAVRQDDVAALLCSSGTTGASKRVALTHANLIAMVELFVRFEASQYPWDASENVCLDVVPMFHVYGLALFALGFFSLGSTVVVMRRFNAEGAVKAIEKYGVTHFHTVPPVLASLVMASRDLDCQLSSLKQVSSGAAPLNEDLLRRFMKSFPHVDFIQGYGLTESAAVGTRGFNTKLEKKYMSVGLLAPNMQAKVVDWSTGSCLPPGHNGELLLRGPGIMKGYLDDENATASTITRDGWLKTGDIAYFDQDGYLYIVDRMKEMIKYKGHQIAPADLEAVLISHPEIADVAVTCAPDEAAGEIPVAFIVRKAGSHISSDEVIEYVSKQVAPFKKVRKVVFVDSIPKSPAGKVLRRLLKCCLISKL